MKLSKKVLKQFTEMSEKQDILLKMTSKDELLGYSISETHSIKIIGRIDKPNVTKIASKLSMTRGAVSKIIKRLIAKGDIVSYQIDDNQKEIYYKLTEQGNTIFKEHQKRHLLTDKRDQEYFDRIPEEELRIVSSFLENFNRYLEEKIEEYK